MFKRKYLYINMILIVCMFFLVMLFKQSVQEEDLSIQQNASEIILKEKTKAKEALGKDVNNWSPLLNVEKNSIEKYSTVSKKNLFRPDRKEWEPPPPPPKAVEKKEEEKKEEEEPEPEAPELPKPFLYGIVIAGKSKRMAIMRGHTQPEVKPRFREIVISGVKRKIPLPTRKVQPVLDKKSSVYEVGDYVSGAKIVSIEKDLVTLKRDNGTSLEIKLFDKEVKKPSTPGAKTRRGAPKRPTSRRSWLSQGAKNLPFQRRPTARGNWASPGSKANQPFQRNTGGARNWQSRGLGGSRQGQHGGGYMRNSGRGGIKKGGHTSGN